MRLSCGIGASRRLARLGLSFCRVRASICATRWTVNLWTSWLSLPTLPSIWAVGGRGGPVLAVGGVVYGPLFVCRKCAGCDYYQTQQSGDALTVIDNRLLRIRRKLGATDGATGERLPDRPRYMHYRTYARLAAEYLELQEQSENVWLGQMVQRFGLETPRQRKPRGNPKEGKKPQGHPKE